MNEPKYTAVIRVPVFAQSEDEAYQRIAPYIRDMRVQADVTIESREATEEKEEAT